MKSLYRKNKCDGCGKPLMNNDKVVALVPDIHVTTNKTDETQLRLKLSVEAIDSRAIKIYCNKCLNLNRFLIDTEEEDC